MSLGIVRHEQAERGAHEGSSGQLYRPTARDGAVGHARGQGVQVKPLMLFGRTADRPVFVSVHQQRDTSFANIPLHAGLYRIRSLGRWRYFLIGGSSFPLPRKKTRNGLASSSEGCWLRRWLRSSL
jgi:hypothetical protein